MELPDDLLCLFSGEAEVTGDAYVIDVPERELTDGVLQEGAVYRVALLGQEDSPSESPQMNRVRDASNPPVSLGDERTVDIDAIGEQGDGIARVERGFVVIVPDTEKGERVTIEITDVTETVAFAEVREREAYYQ